jgi:hypothetical protein
VVALTWLDLQVSAINVTQPLVFSFKLMADIMLNKTTSWDDEAIATLNPGLTLPRLAIIVVFDNRPAVNRLWINALREQNSDFALQVRTTRRAPTPFTFLTLSFTIRSRKMPPSNRSRCSQMRPGWWPIQRPRDRL